MEQKKLPWVSEKVFQAANKYKTLFRIVTRPGTNFRCFETGTVADEFEETRLYRGAFIWCLLQPYIAALFFFSVVMIAFSVAFYWPQLSSRFGAVLVACTLISGFIEPFNEDAVRRFAFSGSFAKSLDANSYSSKLQLFMGVVGTLFWAFGDWFTCWLHEGEICSC